MANKKAVAVADDRESRISKICATINAGTHGGENKDAVTWLGSRDSISVEKFSSGCPSFDDALGGGGWPKGRFIEIYGPESGGKTTTVLEAIAQHQKAYPDEDCALIDTEYTFDEEYARAIGVETKYLIVHQPDNGEQALNILSQLIQLGIKCIIVDSVAAITPKSELEGDVGEGSGMAEQARIMSQALRRLTVEAGQRGVTVFWTNQLREKIGVMFGDKTVTPAGRALKHYASIRVNIKRISTVKIGPEGDKTAISSKTKADIKKNKVAPPFRSAEFYITYGIGIDVVQAVFDSALELKVIAKKGSWFSFDGQQIGQGREKTLDTLRKDKELYEKISAAVEKFKDDAIDVSSGEESEKPEITKPKTVSRTPVSDESNVSDALTGEDGDVEVENV